MDFPGIIGTGTRALNWYLSTIQRLGAVKFGKEYVVPTKIIGVPFTPINQLLPLEMEKASQLILPYFKEMESMTKGDYLLANITLHEAVQFFNSRDFPSSRFINLHKVIQHCAFDKNENVMIIGSAFTMQHDYLPKVIHFEFPGINIIHPDKNTIQALDNLRKTYYSRADASLARETFEDLVKRYNKVSTFIIACTEHAIALEEFTRTNDLAKGKFINLPAEQCKLLLASTSKYT